ncbi:arylamine N-acetyltransferase family protein [Actinomadura rupiterrae]|uniref:arylamine N-acetyltransferase family protein n=1 Tax=Actinomadura rupiterrae TaxID=559627 RepID=UPI0020A5FB74|nr:arylamine N-acetyltransferase [Actinomadura rupiterrae]MCP2337606.1 N-hydroxyarylamine O-acetyltransferase [Actinomadura rupiterrae]
MNDLWHGSELDLDAYLALTGFDGERAPTLATLRALHRGHTTSIPFENLEPVLGRPVLLDLPSLQAKLVRSARGGYCFEHVTLFAAVLERLGYDFTALVGRVVVGAPEGAIRPATHALLIVRPADDDREWLCDVGFGGGPLEPLEFADGTESEQDGWRFRLVRLADDEFGVRHWTLEQHGPDGWARRHVFAQVPAFPIDYTVGSHYVSTHPRSPFVGRVFAQHFAPGLLRQLDNLALTTTWPDGTSETRDLEPDEFAKTLAEFGIVPSRDDLENTLKVVAGEGTPG